MCRNSHIKIFFLLLLSYPPLPTFSSNSLSNPSVYSLAQGQVSRWIQLSAGRGRNSAPDDTSIKVSSKEITEWPRNSHLSSQGQKIIHQLPSGGCRCLAGENAWGLLCLEDSSGTSQDMSSHLHGPHCLLRTGVVMASSLGHKISVSLIRLSERTKVVVLNQG